MKNAECNFVECNSVENRRKCNYCRMCIVLFSTLFTINVGIGAYFVYYKYINCNKGNASKYGYVYQTKYVIIHINEKNHTNRDQKLNLLFFQWHN